VTPFDYDRFGAAFVDMRLHRLRVLITEQSDELFRERGIEASSAAASVLLLLLERKHASITQIAEALGYSHQLINHRLKQLEALGLLARIVDARDRRKWLVKLTAKGRAEANRVAGILPLIASAFDALFARAGIDLSAALEDARADLVSTSLSARVASGRPRKRA